MSSAHSSSLTHVRLCFDSASPSYAPPSFPRLPPSRSLCSFLRLLLRFLGVLNLSPYLCLSSLFPMSSYVFPRSFYAFPMTSASSSYAPPSFPRLPPSLSLCSFPHQPPPLRLRSSARSREGTRSAATARPHPFLEGSGRFWKSFEAKRTFEKVLEGILTF